MQLHRVYAIGVVNHPELGLILTQQQIAQGNWFFCGHEVHPGEDWRNVLYLHIKQKTWINHLHFDKILWAQSFPAKIVTPEPVFSFFVHVKTTEKGHGRGYRWVKNIDELEALALFHPLVKSLCQDVLGNVISLQNK